MRERLQQLGALAGLVRDRDLARLATIARDCTTLKAQIEALDVELGERRARLGQLGEADAALRGGADAKWVALMEQRRQALQQQLVEMLARRETAKAVAQRALGRSDVLDRLARKV